MIGGFDCETELLCDPSFLNMFMIDDGFMNPIKSLFSFGGIAVLDVLRLILLFSVESASFSMLCPRFRLLLTIALMELDFDRGTCWCRGAVATCAFLGP